MELEDLLKQNGLKLERRSEFHYQIKGGHLPVNYYPTTRSVYINGMSQGKRGVTDEQIVEFALGRSVPDGVKLFGRKNFKSTKKRMWKKSKMCALCGIIIQKFEDASVDHKIPISKGGSNRADNLQLAHKKCNVEKGNSLPGKKE